MEQFGLEEAVAIALGGMIGGGIYAVLGVVAGIVMDATWFGFVAAGVVALCAGPSYNALNALGDQRGGSVSFVEEFVGDGVQEVGDGVEGAVDGLGDSDSGSGSASESEPDDA